MSRVHIEIFRLRLKIFHTLACFHTLWYRKNHTQVWKISYTSGYIYGKCSIAYGLIASKIQYRKFPKISFRVYTSLKEIILNQSKWGFPKLV